MYWTGNSMNNLLSYCGLIDAKIRASDKDLPVKTEAVFIKSCFYIVPSPSTALGLR
jgi:hypothetical protein